MTFLSFAAIEGQALQSRTPNTTTVYTTIRLNEFLGSFTKEITRLTELQYERLTEKFGLLFLFWADHHFTVSTVKLELHFYLHKQI